MIDTLLTRCRRDLLAGLARAPETAAVTRYFERGKMLRARLVFLSAAAVGGDPSEAMAGAMAIELLHGASLVHDDIIDGSPERRGLPALHRELGVGRAIAIGDYLILHALSELARCHVVADDRHARAMEALVHWGKECCRGEISELGTPPLDAYEHVARRKTGSLFAAAATLGALLAGASRDQTDALAAFGLSVGVAYQLSDDLVDERCVGAVSDRRLLHDAVQSHLRDAQNQLLMLPASQHSEELANLIGQFVPALAR
jgi:geranylgeranyl diphosphate synthase type I